MKSLYYLHPLIFHYLVDWQSRFSSWAHLNPLLPLFNSTASIHSSEENPLNSTSIKTEKESLYFYNTQNYINSHRRKNLGHRHRNEYHQLEESHVLEKKKAKIDFSIHMSFLTQNQTIASLSSLLYSHCCLFNNSFWYFVICQNVPLWSHRLLTTL